VIEVPEKGRDTTGQGRAIGPERMELLERFRVLPFCARRQNRFDYARRLIKTCEKPTESSCDGRLYLSEHVANCKLECVNRDLCATNRDLVRRKPGGSSSRPERGGGRERRAGQAASAAPAGVPESCAVRSGESSPSAGWREVAAAMGALEGVNHR